MACVLQLTIYNPLGLPGDHIRCCLCCFRWSAASVPAWQKHSATCRHVAVD